jgi:hypothetical protein
MLVPKDAAGFLGVSLRTLQRLGDSGPEYVRISPRRLRYSKAALLAYKEANRENVAQLADLDSADRLAGATNNEVIVVGGTNAVILTGFTGGRIGLVFSRDAEEQDPCRPGRLVLPPVATCLDVRSVTFFDVTGWAGKLSIEIAATEDELINGNASVWITTAHGSVTLTPFVFGSQFSQEGAIENNWNPDHALKGGWAIVGRS